MAFPDAWQEVAIVTIIRYAATTPVKFAANAITETIDISEPDYPGESIPNIAGGRVWKQSPQEDGEITLEIYPVSLDITTSTAVANNGLFQFFATGQTIDVSDPSQPISTATSYGAGVARARDIFCVSIMWSNDTTPPTDATATTAGATDSLRFTALSCRMTSHKAEYTDGILKATVTFKFPAMNQAGTVKMCRWDSALQTAIGALFTNSVYDDIDAWT